MIILPALMIGAAFGAGIWLIARGLAPPPRPLAVALADLNRPRWVDPTGDHGWDTVARRRVSTIARSIGTSDATTRLLRLVERTPERHALDKLVYATLGASLPLVGAATMALGSVRTPAAIPILASVALGSAGFFLPEVLLRGEAVDYRRDVNTQLALYLDLVVVLLAGGRGVDGALTAAAEMGDGVAFVRVRRSLRSAQMNRQSLWKALDRLATECGITALSELAASVTLAGESGARVRDSLTAKAQSIRTRLLAEAEAEAHRRSETMTAPVVLMLTGFVVLIGFPAVNSLLTF